MRRLFVLVLVLGLCGVMVGLALAVLPPGGTFTDDRNIHEPNIEAIAAEGITRLGTDGRQRNEQQQDDSDRECCPSGSRSHGSLLPRVGSITRL